MKPTLSLIDLQQYQVSKRHLNTSSFIIIIILTCKPWSLYMPSIFIWLLMSDGDTQTMMQDYLINNGSLYSVELSNHIE